MRNPEHYQYEFNLRDVAEVWRRGSVVASWLLDLAAAALHEDAALEGSEDQVSDSGEGRWNAITAIESGKSGWSLRARWIRNDGKSEYSIPVRIGDPDAPATGA